MFLLQTPADPGWLDLLAEIWNRWHDEPVFWVIFAILSVPALLYLYNFTVEQAVKARVPGAANWVWSRRFGLEIVERKSDLVRLTVYSWLVGAGVAFTFLAWYEVDGDFRLWANLMLYLFGFVFLVRFVGTLLNRVLRALVGKMRNEN